MEMLYKEWNEAIEFYDDYSLTISEAKYRAAKGKGLKILTPKQILQRLPTALAQINVGNTSENLLHEIQQIKCIELCMDLCNKQKKLLKKYIIILWIH